MNGCKRIGSWIARLFMLATVLCPAVWAQSVSAGISVDNKAHLVFSNAATGFVSQLDSNTVSAKVDASGNLRLISDQAVIRPPGSPFSFLHTLTNTGNGTTTYAVTVTPVTGSGFVLQALQTYSDTNNNSKIDSGEALLTPGFTVTLQAGQSTGFVIYGIVPAGAVVGASSQVSILAVTADGKLQAANTDTIRVGAAVPVLQLTKTADTTSPQPGSPVTFTIVAINNGISPAAGARVSIDGTAQALVTIRDQVPASTVFAAITRSTGTTALYHRRGDELQSYLSAPPSDLTTVDAVAFAIAGVDIGQTVSVAFRVVVALNASGNISNVAQGIGANGATGWQVQSNVLLLPLPSTPPVIAFYTGDSFRRKALVWSAGLPLYIQANAALCNVDPLTAETHPITVISTLTNDVETLTAVETGANTGMFRVIPNPPTRNAALNPVIHANGIVEVSRGDTLTAVLQGCGSASVQTTILIDPSGLVFDSRTNQPVANSRVTLIDVTGQGNGGHPGETAAVLQPDAVTAAPGSVVTAEDGRFLFPLVAASTYRITVQPPSGFTYPSILSILQLPSSRFVDFNGSYTRSFTITGTGGMVKFDQPVDRAVSGTTMLEKTVSRAVAQLGEYLDYTVSVKNVSSVPVTNLTVTDTLPRDFIYQLGTTRINGVVAPDPQGGHGPNLGFLLSSVVPDLQVDLTYRVRMGPGAKLGKNINYAIATDGTTTSNTASATVDVQGGVFSAQGFVIGKIFMDCNGDRKQDAGELGIPGVRVLLEDQTYAITDSDGKYSIYGISPRTHILKLDSETLPAGYMPEALSNRNAGASLSLFVDLKNGEMFKSDFATSCSESLMAEVGKRIKEFGRRGSDPGAALAGTFNYETVRRGTSELRASPSSGIVGTAPAASSVTGSGNGTAVLPVVFTASPAASLGGELIHISKPAATMATAPLEELAPKLDGKLGFINLQDGKITAYTQTLVQVEGPSGSEFKLFINNQEVSEKRVGKKVSDPEHHVTAWEFVGVELTPGSNRLKLLQMDQFGNQRGESLISITAPKSLHKFQLEIPKGAVADGETPVKISVHLVDVDDIPVTIPVEVTLEATEGQWLEKDADPRQPGVQVYVSGGYAEFALRPPATPMSGIIRLSSGNTKAEERIDFLPDLRPMIIAGVVDEIISFRNFSGNAVSAAQSGDGFEQELRQLSISNAAGNAQMQSHVALSLKGKVAGSYLLTLAYDSDKTDQRLFRDIQPDEFYPVYGDYSVRGYDAQSTSRAYLRVDKGKSYILYGDFTTQDSNPARYLSVYNRSVTGAREHFQNDHVNFTAFATHDSSTQQLEELPANGTSGPYMLKNSNREVNSETISILVRDRNQPAVILTLTPLARFVDYELEPYTGEVIFKSPVASFDENLNPVSIRVTYETDQGGQRFWVSGFDGTFKISRMLQVGAVYVADLNPSDAFHITGFNSTIKFDSHTTLTGEFVSTQKDSVGNGDGYHFELLHEGAGLKARVYFGRTDKTFDNINALINQGRGEGGLKLNWKLNSSTRLVADGIRTEDTNTGGTQVAALFGVERTLPHHAQYELGMRYVEQGQLAASTSTTATTGAQYTSIRTKLTVPAPGLPKLRVYGEYEQDVQEMDKKIMALGGTYQVFERGKVYVREELISSLGNELSLTTQQQQAATVFGMETDYLKNAHLFSEYRERNDFYGRENEAAIGLRNLWPLRPGLKFSTGAESVRVLKGNGSTNALALTSSVEYTAHPNWKGSARLEWRGTSNSQSFLNTLGVVVKMGTNWSMLGRNVYNNVNSTSGPANDQLRNRSQLGFAYRDTATSVWNLLAMVEFRDERDHSATVLTNQKYAVLSANVNYQPTAKLVISTRYATKFTVDQSIGLESSSGGDHLVSARMTYDVGPKWDVGFQTSLGFSNGLFVGLGTLQYGVGPEMGRVLAQNLWVSVGYNVFGFRDTYLVGENATNSGPYIRLRYKFDESLFKGKKAQK